jgi:putative membrane protein
MLMSEWPKETRPGCFGWRQFLQAWKALAAGLATFLMSGLLGFLLIYRAPVPAESAFQNLMPAFVGLFTMPWLLINLVTATRAPAQNCTIPAITADRLLAGGVAGSLGGGFAAFVPVITGGVGGFLAGHATGVRNDQVFLVSQGASKVVYYTGAALLLFVPGLNLVRGGGGIIMNAFHSPFSHSEFLYAAGCVAVAAAVSLSMVMPLTRMILWLVAKAGMRMLSLISLCVVVGLVFLLARLAGIGVMLTALGIGLVPVLFGSRRMNCLGIILLPIASMMSGIGDDIARLLGLI